MSPCPKVLGLQMSMFGLFKGMKLWINVLLWIFNFLESWCWRRITLTLFLRFKCSNGKTDSPKSGIHNFWEEPVDCWADSDLKQNWAFAVSLKVHWRSWHTSETCCCHQKKLLTFDFWLAKSNLEETKREENIFFSAASRFGTFPFLRRILWTACKYLAFQIVLLDKQNKQ